MIRYPSTTHLSGQEIAPLLYTSLYSCSTKRLAFLSLSAIPNNLYFSHFHLWQACGLQKPELVFGKVVIPDTHSVYWYTWGCGNMFEFTPNSQIPQTLPLRPCGEIEASWVLLLPPVQKLEICVHAIEFVEAQAQIGTFFSNSPAKHCTAHKCSNHSNSTL